MRYGKLGSPFLAPPVARGRRYAQQNRRHRRAATVPAARTARRPLRMRRGESSRGLLPQPGLVHACVREPGGVSAPRRMGAWWAAGALASRRTRRRHGAVWPWQRLQSGSVRACATCKTWARSIRMTCSPCSACAPTPSALTPGCARFVACSSRRATQIAGRRLPDLVGPFDCPLELPLFGEVSCSLINTSLRRMRGRALISVRKVRFRGW